MSADRPGVLLEILSSPDLAERAAEVVADAIRDAIARNGRCSIALSGGSTPAPMFLRLARAVLDWSAVDVFQVDERVAPAGHPDRNLTLIERELCDHVVGDPPRVHAMDVTTHRLSEAQSKRGGSGGRSAPGQLDAAADAYAKVLEQVCGRPPAIDVVHLGLGADGHTASLVANDPALNVRDRWVTVTKPYRGYVRMTLTYPVLENAGLVVFVVEGGDKAEALAAVLAGDPALPAGRLAVRDLVVLADPTAAARIAR